MRRDNRRLYRQEEPFPEETQKVQAQRQHVQMTAWDGATSSVINYTSAETVRSSPHLCPLRLCFQTQPVNTIEKRYVWL